MKRLGSLNVGSLHLWMIGVLFVIAASQALADSPRRVIAAGGSVAEIVHALGAGDRLVARDTTASYPPEVTALPDVGYVRRLSAENLIALAPDLILAEHDAGPPEVMDILVRSGIPLVVLPEARDPAGVADKIMMTAQALGLEPAGQALAHAVKARLAEAEAASAAMTTRPRVMFILSMQGGRILASGAGTAADAMLRLAGAQNAVQGVDGYKPLTDEAVIAAAPDVILMMDRGGDHGAAVADIAAHPALALTPAGARWQVIRMDGLYLLGFGPRSGDAALDLNARLRAALVEARG